jgi:hypothetical protein
LIRHSAKEKGRGAGGGVEDEGVLVDQSLGAAEAGLEQPVYRVDNVADDGFRSVKDASDFPHGRIVGGQEGLVEVDNGVFPSLAPAKVPEDLRHVGVLEEFDHVIHGPGNGVRHPDACNLLKELPQEGVGAGKIDRGGPTRKGTARRVRAGGKEAVGQGLGKHVGELMFVQIGDERIPKGLQPLV